MGAEMDQQGEVSLPDDYIFRHFLGAIKSNLMDRNNSSEPAEEKGLTAVAQSIDDVLQARLENMPKSELDQCQQDNTRASISPDILESLQEADVRNHENDDAMAAKPSLVQNVQSQNPSGDAPTQSGLAKLAFKWYYAGYKASQNPERGEEAYQLAATEAADISKQKDLPYIEDYLTSWYTSGWHSGQVRVASQPLASGSS